MNTIPHSDGTVSKEQARAEKKIDNPLPEKVMVSNSSDRMRNKM